MLQKDFHSYYAELDRHVLDVEKDFPEFYSVVHQMKEEKTPQSIMNVATNDLQKLLNTSLTSEDVNSIACKNLLETLNKVIEKFQSKID